MDIRDDPSTTTTTTTDCDSGDSEGVDYVYEGQKSDERKRTQGRSPRRKKSPKAKSRTFAKCMCGSGRPEDDAEITVFEEDTDTEEERSHRSRPRKPRPSGPGNALGYDGKGHRKVDRRKTAESKTRRAQTPYVEEYPDDAPRPAIFLREHKIPRRSSTSDAKRVRNSEDGSLSSSRGRSPTGKRLPPRPARLSSKESSKESTKHPGHRKRHLDVQGTYEDHPLDSDSRHLQSDFPKPGPATRHLHHEPGIEQASSVTRSLALNDNHSTKYSSSWPLHVGAHLAQRRPKQHDHDYDSEDESDDHPFNNSNNYDDQHRLRQTKAPSSREQDRDREVRHRETSPPDHERVRPQPPRARPRTIVSRASMATMDQGYRSVATSLCEVWRGEAEDWESPCASGSDDNFDSDAEEPVGLLRMEDLPPRRSSPRLLPPRGERRDFGFEATNRAPPPYLPHPSLYMEDLSLGPMPGKYRSQAWPTANRNGVLLLAAPPLLTMEPDAMTDEDDVHHMRPPSRASRWSKAGPTRGWTHPLPPRSRAVSPVFSARRTREFLSPKPTRAARFDFGAWGCDRASRSSLALGLL